MWMLQGIPSRKKICITIVSVVPTVAACGKASLMFNSPVCELYVHLYYVNSNTSNNKANIFTSQI